ncbi:hypothetical protein [Williamsia muralis]|uniref:Uncharacterized protein n=1 Tax=Williamsia marianensis TaxID=85044 RepID=A0A2G3PVJ8_WILMA|nr:hypothetical protein [Williamsia marianensis]PHV69062.1 hypothetical protein CSW57_00035 [Williamsia marianensis]
MTVAVSMRAELRDAVVGDCPAWLKAAFVGMYPDDTVMWPIVDAPTVLASEDEWDWITEHLAVVAGAVDHTLSLLPEVRAGWWLVCTYSTAAEHFLVSTTAPTATAMALGSVVLFSRPPATDAMAPTGVVA